jgi:DNA-binding NtrC family response regulator
MYTENFQMTEEGEPKILICDMINSHGTMLHKLLLNSFKNVVLQGDITELKRHIISYNPDVIISGNHLWEDAPGIRFLIALPMHIDTHIIIWSDTINKKILSEVFKKNNLHFIRKTNNDNELMEIIGKIKPIFH